MFGKRNVSVKIRSVNESREGFFKFWRRGSRRSMSVEGPKPEENWRGNNVESLVRGLWTEAESIRSRAESTPRPGCVKLKTVTEKRRSR